MGNERLLLYRYADIVDATVDQEKHVYNAFGVFLYEGRMTFLTYLTY